MVNLVGSLTGEVLNIVTRVLTGPKVSGDGFTHVYFETKQRMAHVLQSLQPTAVAHQGFSYLDLPEEEERWNQDYNVNSKRWMDTLWKQYVDGEIDYDHMIKKIRE